MIGIRQAAVAAMTAIGVMGSIACAALILFTNLQHRNSVVLLDAVTSVRLAERAEVDLLLRERATDHINQSSLDLDLRTGLEEAIVHVSSQAEREALADATARVEDYLAAVAAAGGADTPERRAAFDRAFVGLERFGDVNLEGAHDAELRTARLNGMANAIGATVGVLMLGILVTVFAGLQWAIVRPALEICRAIERFQDGDQAARARLGGARELRELSERFNAMATSSVARDRSRITFVAGVAHDLRDPLAAIQLATPDPTRPIPSEDRLRAVFDILRRQVGRLQHMVADLLDAARIEAGHLSLRREDADVRAVVRHAADALNVGSDDHEIALDLPTEPVMLHIDPFRIEQAVTNLLSNAIKYSPAGSDVRVSVRIEDGGMLLDVSDRGIGVVPDELESVWEPFRRGGTSAEPVRGVGLGLFVAKSVVEAHGGEVRARSRVGTGSTFTIWLPLAPLTEVGAELTTGASSTSPAT